MARFEDVKPTFWDRESTEGVGPPVTAQTIAAAHARLGVRLPAEYLELLSIQNGGQVAPAWDAFPTDERRNGWGDGFVGLPHLYGLSATAGVETAQASDDVHDPDWGPPRGMVIVAGPDAPHIYVLLDYRECGPRGTPPVVWHASETLTMFELAPSFRAFVEGLRATDSFPRPELPPLPPRRWWQLGRR